MVDVQIANLIDAFETTNQRENLRRNAKAIQVHTPAKAAQHKLPKLSEHVLVCVVSLFLGRTESLRCAQGI